MLAPTVNAPFVKVKVPPIVRLFPIVAEPVDVLLIVKLFNTLVVPGVEGSKRSVPKAPVPKIDMFDVAPPRIYPLPVIPDAIKALPNVRVYPFRSSISFVVERSIAFPVLGPSQRRLLRRRMRPPDLLETI